MRIAGVKNVVPAIFIVVVVVVVDDARLIFPDNLTHKGRWKLGDISDSIVKINRY